MHLGFGLARSRLGAPRRHGAPAEGHQGGEPARSGLVRSGPIGESDPTADPSGRLLLSPAHRAAAATAQTDGRGVFHAPVLIFNGKKPVPWRGTSRPIRFGSRKSRLLFFYTDKRAGAGQSAAWRIRQVGVRWPGGAAAAGCRAACRCRGCRRMADVMGWHLARCSGDGKARGRGVGCLRSNLV